MRYFFQSIALILYSHLFAMEPAGEESAANITTSQASTENFEGASRVSTLLQLCIKSIPKIGGYYAKECDQRLAPVKEALGLQKVDHSSHLAHIITLTRKTWIKERFTTPQRGDYKPSDKLKAWREKFEVERKMRQELGEENLKKRREAVLRLNKEKHL